MDWVKPVSDFISNVGFPIVACCAMGWFCVKMNDTLKDLTIAITNLTAKFDDHINKED